jgi:hypothetical protein
MFLLLKKVKKKENKLVYFYTPRSTGEGVILFYICPSQDIFLSNYWKKHVSTILSKSLISTREWTYIRPKKNKCVSNCVSSKLGTVGRDFFFETYKYAPSSKITQTYLFLSYYSLLIIWHAVPRYFSQQLLMAEIWYLVTNFIYM